MNYFLGLSLPNYYTYPAIFHPSTQASPSPYFTISPNIRGEMEKDQDWGLSRGRATRGARQCTLLLPRKGGWSLGPGWSHLIAGMGSRLVMFLGLLKKQNVPPGLHWYGFGGKAAINQPLGAPSRWQHCEKGSDPLSGSWSWVCPEGKRAELEGLLHV